MVMRQLRHVVALGLGAEQEVGDVGVEPEVAAARTAPRGRSRRPSSAWRAGWRWRRVMRWSSSSSVPMPIISRHVVEIEQRQGAARDLLGAAIGVAVEREQQAGHVEPGDRPDREGQRAGVRHQLGEVARIERDRLRPARSGSAGWWLRGALAARTPSVSSLTSASPSGAVTISLRSWSPIAVPVRPRSSDGAPARRRARRLVSAGVGREALAGDRAPPCRRRPGPPTLLISTSSRDVSSSRRKRGGLMVPRPDRGR